MFRSLIFAALLGVALFTVSGCGSQPPKSEDGDTSNQNVAQLSNTVCPIMEHEIDTGSEEKVSVEWNGKTVYFCCEDCIPKWKKLSDEEKQEKLDEAKAKAAE